MGIGTRSLRPSAEPTSGSYSTGLGTRADVVTYLTLWVVLLYGIYARQVVPGLGAIGTPALLLALPTLMFWVAGWVAPHYGLSRDRHPIRAALFVYLCFHLLSFSVASSRPLTSLESTGSARALLTTVAMVGIALLAADGIANSPRLEALLRRVVYAGGFLGLYGLAQYLTRQPLLFLLPGLTWNADPRDLASRGVEVRPAGTALHPIEFGVVTGALVPLAIHFALYAPSKRQRAAAAAAGGFLVLGMPLAASRSGIVSVVVGLLILFTGWRGRRLLNGLLAVCVTVPIIWATVPGVVGTMFGLFTDTGDDISIQARLNRVPRIMALIRERPLLGLGSGTWSIEDYFLIDNELFVTTLESGLVGLTITVALLVGAVVLCLCLRNLVLDDRTRHLVLALGASIAGLTVSLATFDSFHYHILTGTLFLLVGTAGALWRIHRGSELASMRWRAGRMHRG